MAQDEYVFKILLATSTKSIIQRWLQAKTTELQWLDWLY